VDRGCCFGSIVCFRVSMADLNVDETVGAQSCSRVGSTRGSGQL